MNVKEYISSGILETYVLGHCTPQEIAEVEQYMLVYPQIREELAAVRLLLESYADLNGKTPPASLKNQIWEAIQNETRSEESKIIPISRTNNTSWKLMVAASFLLFVIAAAMNVFLYSKWKSAEEKIVAIQTEKEYFANQYQTEQANFTALQSELAFIQNPNTKTVSLKGVEKFPEALATIFWNTNSKEVYIKINNLPEAPSGNQYQLWAIVNGTPVNAGVLDSSSAQFQKMIDFSEAQAFAITLEPAGGSVNPHLDKMYVVGNI